jgi:hypothetical protein
MNSARVQIADEIRRDGIVLVALAKSRAADDDYVHRQHVDFARELATTICCFASGYRVSSP